MSPDIKYQDNRACACSVVSDSVTPWTIACQAPLSMGFRDKNTGLEEVAISFSRGSSWPRDQTLSPVSAALAGSFWFFFFFATEPPGKPKSIKRLTLNQTSQFIIYLPCFCFTLSMWLEVFLYAVVILITFVLPRKVSLNSLRFVLCLSLEMGNWTNSLNRETFSLRIWKCH